jgi:4-amino-4-deoxy-L-arabinose transferase-like glycosyltransferase
MAADVKTPPGPLAAATQDRERRFWRVLLLIVLAALAVRVGYVVVAKRHEPALGDQIYYRAQANTLARGEGFTDPRDGSQTAEHPPLTALALTPTSWVMERFDEGGDHLLAQRLTMTVFGAAVVLVIGLIGRAVAGDRAGLLAAGLAAIAPNLWVNDALVMSETLAALAVALAILFAYRFARDPTVANAALVGACIGLAMLVRAELGLLLPLMVLPMAWFAHRRRDGEPGATRAGFGVGGVATRFLVACLAALLLVSPWVVANLVRFDEPVFFSTNDGLTLCGANLHRTYYGQGTGLWALDCANFHTPPGDRSVVSNALRDRGFEFMGDHLGRLPAVMGVRVARVWSLYAPGFMATYNLNEGREEWVSWLGFVSFWLTVPFAVAGGVTLRRRRVPLTPLVAQFIVVTLTAALIYGLVRFRVPAEVALVVLAAVALDDLLDRRRTRAPGSAEGMPAMREWQTT